MQNDESFCILYWHRYFCLICGSAYTSSALKHAPKFTYRACRFSGKHRNPSPMQTTFLDPGRLADDQLQLQLTAAEPPEQSTWKVPTYRFDIQRLATAEHIGRINFRLGDTQLLTHYAGQVGYAIDEQHRGHHFAERACRLLLPFAARHGLDVLWITCGPDNPASRRTLERLGAQLMEIVDVPEAYPIPAVALRKKCRYRLNLTPVHPAIITTLPRSS
jgi:tagatose 1,6-diphosphate aldolase